MQAHQPLEELRQLFADKRVHVQIGTIAQMEISPTRSSLRVLVNLQPDDHQLVAKWTWPIIDDESGVLMLPAINDLVTVGLVDGDEENAWILSHCSSAEERLAIECVDGSLVLKARKGKPTRVLSDTKVLIQKGSFGGAARPDATEPLVLGNVLKQFETDLINAFINAPQIGQCAVGPVFLDPGLITTLNALIAQYLTTATTNILSQIGFTERGT